MNRLDGKPCLITASDFIGRPLGATGTIHLIDDGWNCV
jgi:hypothetical protein